MKHNFLRVLLIQLFFFSPAFFSPGLTMAQVEDSASGGSSCLKPLPKKNELVQPSALSDTLKKASPMLNAPAIQNILTKAGYEDESVGVYIFNLNTDSIVAGYNASKSYIPASVLKCVTAASAFDLLGLSYRFKTEIYLSGAFNADNGVVGENLYIRGGADPGFLAERMWLFVNHLYHKGVRKISKDIILDDSFFDSVTLAPGYGEDKTSRAYVAPVGALSASFNTIAIHHRPGGRPGSPVHLDIFPPVKGLSIESTAKTTSSANTGIRLRTRKKQKNTILSVTGSMGVRSKSRYTYRKVWEPRSNFGQVLLSMFDEVGITVLGTVRHDTVPGDIRANRPFYVFESQPLSEFVEHMFKYSSNFAAEMIFKTLSAEDQGGKNGNWPASQKLVTQWWESRKFPDSLVMANGSGMGSKNRLSPEQLVSVLQYAYTNKAWFPEYLAALSNAGYDGTLKSRFKSSWLKGALRGKTGTLNSHGVSSLAGYVFVDRNIYLFAIIINNTKRGHYEHWMLQQRILEKILHPSRSKK